MYKFTFGWFKFGLSLNFVFESKVFTSTWDVADGVKNARAFSDNKPTEILRFLSLREEDLPKMASFPTSL